MRKKMKIAIGNDHAATELKFVIMDYLKELGHEVINLGLVWMYSLKNTVFINSLFYRIGRNGNLSYRQK